MSQKSETGHIELKIKHVYGHISTYAEHMPNNIPNIHIYRTYAEQTKFKQEKRFLLTTDKTTLLLSDVPLKTIDRLPNVGCGATKKN